jgi:hypothetical protein
MNFRSRDTEVCGRFAAGLGIRVERVMTDHQQTVSLKTTGSGLRNQALRGTRPN